MAHEMVSQLIAYHWNESHSWHVGHVTKVVCDESGAKASVPDYDASHADAPSRAG